jgi:hypothetical protein
MKRTSVLDWGKSQSFALSLLSQAISSYSKLERPKRGTKVIEHVCKHCTGVAFSPLFRQRLYPHLVFSYALLFFLILGLLLSTTSITDSFILDCASLSSESEWTASSNKRENGNCEHSTYILLSSQNYCVLMLVKSPASVLSYNLKTM